MYGLHRILAGAKHYITFFILNITIRRELNVTTGRHSQNDQLNKAPVIRTETANNTTKYQKQCQQIAKKIIQLTKCHYM